MQARGLDYYSPRLFHDATSSFQPYDVSKFEEILPGFPPSYTGARVWTGSDMALKQQEWIVTLSEQDQIDVLMALRQFQSKIFTSAMIYMPKVAPLTHNRFEPRPRSP